MAQGAYRRSSFLFFLFHLFSLSIPCSGTLVEFSSDGRSKGLTSIVKTTSTLKLNKGFPSRVQVLVSGDSLLDKLPNSSLPVDIYLTQTQFGNRSSIKSLVSWLKTQLKSFPQKLNLRSVVLSYKTADFSQQYQLQVLLPFLRSIYSLLSRLQLEKTIKVSTSFSLPLLNSLDMKQKRELDSILHFLRKTKSFVIIEDSAGLDLKMVDVFVHSLVRKVSVANSLLSHVDIPVVLSIKSSLFHNATEVSALNDKISKSLDNLYNISSLHRLKPLPSSHRVLLTHFDHHATKHDSTTSFPTSPVTNPSSLPPFSPTPTIITIPGTNPTPVTPANPTVIPLTNPATTYPGAQPATNPVTTYPPPMGGVPVTGPVAGTNPPPVVGHTWCIARTGVAESTLQQALDYACGIGEADCSMIQVGASCYNPNTLENHASFAFNSYFLKNPVASGCDFGGAAVLVNTNPSYDSCVYPSPTAAAVPSSVPPSTTASPSGTTGTGSSYGAPPSIPIGVPMVPPSIPIGTPPSVPMVPIIGSNPTSSSPTGYGSEYPPLITTPPTWSASVHPLIGIMTLVTSLALGILQ